MKYAFAVILVLAFVSNSVFAGENYKYKDIKFEKITFNEKFFSDILLEKNSFNEPKYEEEKEIIKKQFQASVITPFRFDALNTIKTENKTIIIVFRDHTDLKLLELLRRFLPIQQFADSFKEDGTVVSFTHVGENGCRFLIVKQSFNFQDEDVDGKTLSGKGLSYVLNHLTKVVKVSSYKNRFRSYKPGDDYAVYRKHRDTRKNKDVILEMGYFEGSVYINPSLGFTIDLPQWDRFREFQRHIAQEEGIYYDFGYTHLFLLSKYPQSRDFPYNPEMCLSVAHVKEQSLESYIEENGYQNMGKGKISGKDVYTVRRSYPVKDHETGRSLDYLPLINRKIIFFKNNGLVGEMGIMYRNEEQEKELEAILATIQLK